MARKVQATDRDNNWDTHLSSGQVYPCGIEWRGSDDAHQSGAGFQGSIPIHQKSYFFVARKIRSNTALASKNASVLEMPDVQRHMADLWNCWRNMGATHWQARAAWMLVRNAC